MSTTMTIEERVRALVGTPSRAEVAKLWGRKSSLRAAARALGVDRYLPGPPPVEEDVSLQNAAKDEARRLRRLNAPPSSRSQAGITKADRLGANRRKCAKQ